jgi:hypothetical protein
MINCYGGILPVFRPTHISYWDTTSSKHRLEPRNACISGLSSASSEDSNKVGSLSSPLREDAESDTYLLVLWCKEI